MDVLSPIFLWDDIHRLLQFSVVSYVATFCCYYGNIYISQFLSYVFAAFVQVFKSFCYRTCEMLLVF
jgi:hypothetical protein